MQILHIVDTQPEKLLEPSKAPTVSRNRSLFDPIELYLCLHPVPSKEHISVSRSSLGIILCYQRRGIQQPQRTA
jgi:hypothetical protein